MVSASRTDYIDIWGSTVLHAAWQGTEGGAKYNRGAAASLTSLFTLNSSLFLWI